MPVTSQFHNFPVGEILIPDRIRIRESEIDSLKDSISRVGLINPLVIRRTNELVAGFRRLSAVKALGWPTVPVQYLDELDTQEALVVELEENLKRVDLHWLDEARAMTKFHDTMAEIDPEWNIARTAKSISLDPSNVSKRIQVIHAINNGMEDLAQAPGFSQAHTALARRRTREIDNEMSRASDTEKLIANAAVAAITSPGETPPPPPPPEPTAEESVVQGDFRLWAPHYTGPRFDFIHCDFPYGLDMDKTNLQSTNKITERYADSEELYFELIHALTANIGRLVHTSAHVMFWFSMKFYRETLQELERVFEVQEFPLVWLKSDNKGILPDHRRGPRRIYETALILSLGDRFIVKPMSNAYAAPTNKAEAEHLSEKPEPMLRYFMEMFVDDLSSVLDPTCGGGTALTAAESLGAARVFGLDILQSNVETSRQRLARARRLRALHSNIGEIKI